MCVCMAFLVMDKKYTLDNNINRRGWAGEREREKEEAVRESIFVRSGIKYNFCYKSNKLHSTLMFWPSWAGTGALSVVHTTAMTKRISAAMMCFGVQPEIIACLFAHKQIIQAQE